MVTTTLTDNNKMKTIISFDVAVPKEVCITLTASSSKTDQRLIAERSVVYTLLQLVDMQLGYMFLDYNHFKLKAFERNEDVLAMTPGSILSAVSYEATAWLKSLRSR